jgi:hypothetical protein
MKDSKGPDENICNVFDFFTGRFLLCNFSIIKLSQDARCTFKGTVS